MKNYFTLLFLMFYLATKAQKDVLCFVTSVKGEVFYKNDKLKPYDTIWYQNVRKLLFKSPGIVTLYSEKGSCKVYTEGDYSSEKPESELVFVKDILRLDGKTISLSSRGNCDCLTPYECVNTNPGINEQLLIPDTFYFPAKFDFEAYDSCYYFLQWQHDNKAFNNRLKTIKKEVIITKEDLYFDQKYYNEDGRQELILGICNYSKGKRTPPSVVAKIKPNPVSNASLNQHYEILKIAMAGQSPREVYEAFCIDVYTYYGKPDLCQLKKIINYKEN